MFCTSCGTALPDAANFCSNCGLQLNEGFQRQRTTRTQWEYCVIHTEQVSPTQSGRISNKPGTSQFWAKAVSPKGVYRAGYSVSTWPSDQHGYSGDSKVDTAWDELFTQLLKDGWEPFWTQKEHDAFAWQKQFKRLYIAEL